MNDVIPYVNALNQLRYCKKGHVCPSMEQTPKGDISTKKFYYCSHTGKFIDRAEICEPWVKQQLEEAHKFKGTTIKVINDHLNMKWDNGHDPAVKQGHTLASLSIALDIDEDEEGIFDDAAAVEYMWPEKEDKNEKEDKSM